MKTNLKTKFGNNFINIERRLPLEKFIPAAFLIFLLSVFLLSIITYSFIEEYKKERESINQIRSTVKNIEDIRSKIYQVPLLKRGYIITKDKKYLNDFYALQRETLNEVDSLDRLISSDVRQKNLNSKLKFLLREEFNLLNSTIANDTGSNSISATQIETTNKVHEYLQSIAEVSKQMEEHEINLLNQKYQNAQQTNFSIQLFIILMSFFSFVVIALSLFISKSLIRNKNKAERLLMNSYGQLENQVDLRTRELQNANSKLKDMILVKEKVERSLRESERRFRVMADSAPVMIWMCDIDKLIYYFNSIWYQYTGKKYDEEQGNGWIKGIHHEDSENFIREFSSAFDKREKFEIEFRLRNHKGEYCWVLNKGVPRFEDNEFIGYIGGAVEIDKIKRSEKYFRIQYKVSKILEESRTINDASKKILREICEEIDWNFARLWILNKEKNKLILSSSWNSVFIPVNNSEPIKEETVSIDKGEGLSGKVWESGRSFWETDIASEKSYLKRDVDGASEFNSAFAVPISKDSEVISVLEFFNKNNVSPQNELLEILEVIGRQIGEFLERKKAEEQLKESYTILEDRVKERTLELANTLTKLLKEIEDREKIQNQLKLFAHAIKGIKEFIFITDLDFNTIFVNQAFESMYGYHLDELKNGRIPILFSEFVPKKLRAEISSATIRGGWRGELQSISKDGNKFFINLSTTVIRNEDGKIQAIIGICQDITEMKEAKELIIKRNSLLRLLNDVIIASNKSFDIYTAVSFAINKICQYTHFEVGHCFLLKNDLIVSTKIWNRDITEEFNLYKEISENRIFVRGEGLPGKCLEQAKSFWVNLENCTDDMTFDRANIAKKIGFKTGIWIPLVKQNEVAGVFEFFHKDSLPRDNEVLETLNNIGAEIGSFIERHEFVEKITSSEKKLIEAQHIAKLGSWEWNIKSNNIFWSQELHNIYEIPTEDFTPTFEGFLERVHPEDVEMVREIIDNSIMKRQPFEFYHRIITPLGKIKILKSQGEVNVDPEGNVIRMFGTGLDITELKMAEEKIKVSEKKLIEAQKIAKLGSWEWDVANDRLTWSDEMYNIFEIEPHEIELNYKNFLELVLKEDQAELENLKQAMLDDKNPFICSYRIKTASGKVKTLNSHSQIYLNGNREVVRVVGATIDITEIKEAEEKTKISVNHLVETQQLGKMGTWETDISNGTQVWSDELYKIYGLKPGEIELRYENIRTLIHPEDLNFVDNINKNFEKNPSPVSFHYRIITGEKDVKYLYSEIQVEFSHKNKPRRIFGSVQDLTELKLVENELGQANIRLVEAYKELVHNEKLAALGRFASGIAHEIRNPLANISALTQLLSKNTFDLKSQKHINYILANTELANKIISDLLDFTSQKQFIFKKEMISELIINTIGSIEARCNEKNIVIIKNIDQDLPSVLLDRMKFENALLNFFSNAIDSMQDGGTLTVIAREDKVSKEIVLNIIDTGVGIPEENLDKILEPFFTTKEHGTGLGLGLAYKTIKAHRGTFKIKSTPGTGTSIEIKLPNKLTSK